MVTLIKESRVLKNCGQFVLQCSTLNEKLNLLLKTLSIESEALPTPAKEDLQSESWESCPDSGPNNNTSNGSNGKQKVFVPRDALMSRANSLKKALKQIIEHTEKGNCYWTGLVGEFFCRFSNYKRASFYLWCQ